MPSYRAVLVLLGVLVGAVVGGCFKGEQPPAGTPFQSQGAFVGSEVCQACHAERFEKLLATPHGRLLRQAPELAARQGCEACHGPGEAHVAAGGGKGVGGLLSFREEAAKARSEVCLACHQQEAERFQFRRSEHKLTGVACTDCHALHAPAPTTTLLRQKTPDLCFSCHREIRRAFALPVRHKVLEGALSCTDCHAPHGGPSRVSLRGVHHETCTRCHTEKGGPFAFEHLASRVEGCTACHTPHGSTNAFLLKRHEERVLCLECHSNAPVFHNQVPGAFFRGDCTRCHTQIHGSNFDRFFFR
jgi:DmsE family decaheme c-type cytochrome